MDFGSVEHRAFDNYCYPLDKDRLQINIRTGRDVRQVAVVWGDPFSWGILGGSEKWKGTRTPVTETKELQQCVWWSVTVRPEFKRCRYYFELTADDGVWM